jgi:hypothetical protein
MRSMKHLLCISLALAFALALVPVQPAGAQMPGLPKLYGEFKMPEVGSYATYKMTFNDTEAQQLVKLAVVGKEKSETGEDLYWYEREETNPKNGRVVIAKMLISGNPQEIGTVHRIIFQDFNEKPQELPQAFVSLLNQPSDEKSKPEEPKTKSLGTEKVKVGEKTLTCKHLRYGTEERPSAEVWTAAEVPLFGLVKSESKDVNMVLVDYGTDAVTGITEEPEQLSMPPGK